MHPHISTLITCIDLEEQEQRARFRLDEQHTLKQLKAEGLALHPIIVTRKNFGYADYPEISFKLSFPPETNLFRDGAALECFAAGEEPVKGVLISLDGTVGEFRLFAPDFPEWIEDDAVGIKLAPDTRTTGIMKKALLDLEHNVRVLRLFEKLHDTNPDPVNESTVPRLQAADNNNFLNESQKLAVATVCANLETTVIHGPPGTGKTTTLVEAVLQLVRSGEKVLVSAPSNTAVDNISKGLLANRVRLLRVGNTSKVDPEILAHTPEGKLSVSKAQKEIKQLKIRAEEFRRMALKYKRSFGKAEREQRNLLFREVKNIRTEIKKMQHYNEEKLFAEADVIAGTPIGLHDAGLQHIKFHTLIMDEAGQCIEPLAWCIFPLAEKVVLAGDHWQLPPTVLSNDAARLGLGRSILEIAIAQVPDVCLLNTQYRMKPAIAGFSSKYFYDNRLLTATHLQNSGIHISFIDTAGSGYEEQHGPDGSSLQNEGELLVVQKLVETEQLDPIHTAIISPYAGQVTAARQLFPAQFRISTIDSFQGQEKEIVIISLVRSNDENAIGFLKDYRRMNVAITRAKEKLYVIGDSATLGSDSFYSDFLTYVETHGSYRSVWEFAI